MGHIDDILFLVSKTEISITQISQKGDTIIELASKKIDAIEKAVHQVVGHYR